MPDVVILRGVSASGKTTFAKRMPRVRISRDGCCSALRARPY